MDNKTLDALNIEDAKQKVKDLKVFGNGDSFILLSKVSSESQGWMESTKVCNVTNGAIVQVSSQKRNPDGSYSLAESICFVPNVSLNYAGGKLK